MRRLLLIAFTLASTAACSGAVSIDYIDFVRHDGIEYVAAFAPLGRALGADDLGAELFRVRQKLDGSGHGPSYRTQDGDAAFIAAGEPVYGVRGYLPSFRVAARHDGRLVLYEADTNPRATRGADLLDLGDKVRAISLRSQKDGRTELGRIVDRARVDALVALVLSASVDQSAAPSPSTGFVAFELFDGTVTSRTYAAESGVLSRGIRVAGGFRDAILELQASAPTPTPAPDLVNLARRYDLAHASRVVVKSVDGLRADASLVAPFAAALDADMPARSARESGSGTTVIGFEFAERSVSFVYDEIAGTLRVVVPVDEELVVRATPAFVHLVAETPLQR
jgi:hypothetical protein